ncbi:MAG: UDP-N-acetylglucosamine 1-carboxyvinyltransferase [Syntrophomonadaceae bacterium]|nr:UDP-N-acetylglucosamine 1-carboxyvinyltransferase [Syntrophomonadaceae bacterium]
MRDSLIIEGGHRVCGEVRVSGAKNASLVIIAASILAHGRTQLENVPKIKDVEVLLDILKYQGCMVEWEDDGTLAIEVPDNILSESPYELSKKLRASNLLLGSLLGRRRQAKISLPGGCDIGSRPMDLHLKGLQVLGSKVILEHGYIEASATKLQGGRIYLDFPSVGATENIMMLASTTPGTTIIDNAAKEPEIVDLANFLSAMGARIRGAGTDLIKIDGAEELKAVRYAVIPDRIEAGTYMAAAAATGGDVMIENVIPTHLLPIKAKLVELGADVTQINGGIRVRGKDKIYPVDIKTLPYPGFPTDMLSQMLAILTIAQGTSVIVENVFENRFQMVDELKRMGAKVKVEGHTAVVEGVSHLHGARVKATDLRAGAALILAAFMARGQTEIDNAHYIFRGYEDIEDKLRGLGVKVLS